jgi:hypothetical protein
VARPQARGAGMGNAWEGRQAWGLPDESFCPAHACRVARCRERRRILTARLRRVHVPAMYPDLTSHRVLSMEFIEGVSDGGGGPPIASLSRCP